MEVYADLYFLVNASMDLLCLSLSALLTHRRCRRFRLLLGGAFGGFYAVVSLLYLPRGVLGFSADLLAAFLMCAIVFLPRAKIRELLPGLCKITAVDVLVSAVLGGILTSLFSFLNRLDLPIDALEGETLPVWIFAILSALSGLLTLRGGKFFGLAEKTKEVTVEAELFGVRATFRAMKDTGNLLTDPVSGRRVIVVERARLLPFLPPEFRKICAAAGIPALDSGDAAVAARVRLIPAKTATGEALLPAFLPDEIILTEGKTRYVSDDLLAPADLGEATRGFDAVIGIG